MFRFEELEIWKESVAYGKRCYLIAGKFPPYERYSLSDQLRRAGVSISNNIVEGSVGTSANFRKFLNIAVGSTLETANILNFAHELGYIDLVEKERMYRDSELLIKRIRAFSNSLGE